MTRRTPPNRAALQAAHKAQSVPLQDLGPGTYELTVDYGEAYALAGAEKRITLARVCLDHSGPGQLRGTVDGWVPIELRNTREGVQCLVGAADRHGGIGETLYFGQVGYVKCARISG